MDETLSIREITNAYLLYNGLTVSYMSRATFRHFYIFRGRWETAAHTKKFLRYYLPNYSVFFTGGNMEQTLDLREIVDTYLDYNGLTRSYMARTTRIPDSTLRDWLDGKTNISQRNLYKIKEFLKGNFLLNVETIINHLLLSKEIEEDES